VSDRVLSLADYPGLSPRITRAPYYDVRIQEAVSGKEMRSTWWGSPRTRYTLTCDSLRVQADLDELRSIVGFFHAHAGSLDSFLLDDGSSYTDMLFGAGDDTTSAYQLQASDVAADQWGADHDGTDPRLWPQLGDGFVPIWEPGAITIYDDGVEVAQVDPGDESQGTCSIAAPGVVVFGYAPLADSPLTWSGTYYTRVRFAEEALSLEQVVVGLWRGGISLVSVKP
jgi:hypothetical protein